MVATAVSGGNASVLGSQWSITSSRFWEPKRRASRWLCKRFSVVWRGRLWYGLRSPCHLLLPSIFLTPYPRRLVFSRFTATIQISAHGSLVGFLLSFPIMPNGMGFHGLYGVVGVAPAMVVVGRSNSRLMARVASATLLVCLDSGRHLRSGGLEDLGGGCHCWGCFVYFGRAVSLGLGFAFSLGWALVFNLGIFGLLDIWAVIVFI